MSAVDSLRAAPYNPLRAVRLAWSTPPTDAEFVTAQALTIQTHFFTGLTLTLALLYAAWWR